MIPGSYGTLDIGRRLLNFVWYAKCAESSPEFAEIMTDKEGRRHRNFLPLRSMREEVWAKQRKRGNEILAPPFVELVNKTNHPFLSAIHDYASPRAAFYDNKLLMVGEALALFRPHLALSFNQAALNCQLLEKAIQGEITIQAWERQVLQYGRRTQLMNIAVGDFFIFGGMAFVKSLVRYILSLLPIWRWRRPSSL